MRVISVCCQRQWRVRLWAIETRSRDWLEAWLRTETGAGEPEMRCEPGDEAAEGDVRWCYEETFDEGDPPGLESRGTIDLTFSLMENRAEVRAQHGALTVILISRPASEMARKVQSALIRAAHADETFRLGLHWFLAWQQTGCADLDEPFSGLHKEASAYFIPDAEAWLSSGAPLAFDEGSMPNGGFLCISGRDMRLSMFAEAAALLEPRSIELAGSWLAGDEPGARAWLAVWNVDRQAGG